MLLSVYLQKQEAAEKTRAAADELSNETGGEGLFLQVDFADLNSIKHEVSEISPLFGRQIVWFNSRIRASCVQ